MFGIFFSYFIIFFIIARIINLTAKINWLPTLKTTPKHDAILSLIFLIVVGVLTLSGFS
ncbi:hypothetical protein UACE39S_00609 [Ureibacillus acetophenoni]